MFVAAVPGLDLGPRVGHAQDPSCFVRRQGSVFLLNGCPFRFAGTNSYYQMIHRRGTDRAGVNEVLDEMAARGMTVVRTWAFQDDASRSDCLQCAPARQLRANERPIQFINEATFRGLDEFLEKARTLRLRVVLALTNHWSDFGGMRRYVLWRFGNTVEGVYAFYNDPVIREWFREYTTLIVNRRNTVNGRIYRDDPTILAWELANEPRCADPMCATDNSLDEWIAEMSCLIKSLDPNHLVTTGMEGFFGPSRAVRNTDSWMANEGQDFLDNHAHPCIDFATFHVWPQNWGWDPIGNTEGALDRARAYTDERIWTAHVELEKPVVLEEFGVPRDSFSTCPNLSSATTRDTFYGQYYSICEQWAQGSDACAGTLNWMVYDAASCAYDDGNGVFLPDDVSTDEMMTQHAHSFGTCAGTMPESDTCRPGGDVDFDCDVDLVDLRRFAACLSGPAPAKLSAPCSLVDPEEDGDADLKDFAALQRAFSGTCP